MDTKNRYTGWRQRVDTKNGDKEWYPVSSHRLFNVALITRHNQSKTKKDVCKWYWYVHVGVVCYTQQLHSAIKQTLSVANGEYIYVAL